MFPVEMIPCVIFEDEHLLVVNKPAGINTHAPGPFAGEGIYDWLRHREPRWSRQNGMAIIHRLDKETSGAIVFTKTPLAHRSLTEQFTQHQIQKKYILLTDRAMKQRELIVKSKIIRVGEKYASGADGELAATRFGVPAAAGFAFTGRLKAELQIVEAFPLTGRTHQIRVHAAENGFPILGDALYGGSSFSRVCLHAAELKLRHPATQKEMAFTVPVDFAADARLTLRVALIDSEETNAFRVTHGASDGWPGWYVDRLGDFFLSQSEKPLSAEQQTRLATIAGPRTAYHKILNRQIRRAGMDVSPKLLFGAPAPERFLIRENNVKFELSFDQGYSVGLFLDQRDNRRRLLTGHVAAGFPPLQPTMRHSRVELLNTFAYTCGFSVCAAMSGARTTSLDLSKNHLEWGKRHFALNNLDPSAHDFIYGDTFDWLQRLAKKHRLFDVVLLDPPTFSESKKHGAFRAEKDYGQLVRAALPVLKPGGVLFASTNAAAFLPEKFLEMIEAQIRATGRKILQKHYAPQPPDFPISRAEPGYLKTLWLRVS